MWPLIFICSICESIEHETGRARKKSEFYVKMYVILFGFEAILN